MLRRMQTDWRRNSQPAADLDGEYRSLAEAFDRAGMPSERAIVRLGHARWLQQHRRADEAQQVAPAAVDLARRFTMSIVLADALEFAGSVAESREVRNQCGCRGPARP